MLLTPWVAVDKRHGKRRGRVARACDACFARKIQCDIAKPRCNWCDHQNQPCTFNRNFRTGEKGRRPDHASAAVFPTEQESWSSSSSSPPPPREDPRSFARNLQFAGRHLGNMILIHQASSRCALWTQNQITHGTHSSLAISVTASRSLLGSFVYSSFELGPQNILFTLSYFMQASIIIFCQLLLHSFDAITQESQNDLKLLSDISERVRNCVCVDDPPCYTKKITFASEVIGELKRLAYCAISKNYGGAAP